MHSNKIMGKFNSKFISYAENIKEREGEENDEVIPMSANFEYYFFRPLFYLSQKNSVHS